MRGRRVLLLGVVLAVSACGRRDEPSGAVDTTLPEDNSVSAGTAARTEPPPPAAAKGRVAMRDSRSIDGGERSVDEDVDGDGQETEQEKAQRLLTERAVAELEAREMRRLRPRGSPSDWVATDDYPPSSLRLNEQGRVGFVLDVDASGSVTGWTITSSSGYEDLDTTACKLMRRRARFLPQRDASGDPVPGRYSSVVVWQIPVG